MSTGDVWKGLLFMVVRAMMVALFLVGSCAGGAWLIWHDAWTEGHEVGLRLPPESIEDGNDETPCGGMTVTIENSGVRRLSSESSWCARIENGECVDRLWVGDSLRTIYADWNPVGTRLVCKDCVTPEAESPCRVAEPGEPKGAFAMHLPGGWVCLRGIQP